MTGRPRSPFVDEATERRREQYRRSKLRTNERLRHEQGRCKRERGEPCPIRDGTAVDRRLPPDLIVVTINGQRVVYHRQNARSARDSAADARKAG